MAVWPTWNAATLDEFKAFNKKYYTPNNAVLVIAGDIDVAKTKLLVEQYFGEIPSGEPIVRTTATEDPITKEIVDTAYDANIQIPAILAAYRIPGMTSKESKALEMASAVLSQGNSSRMYKKMVDDKKNSLQVGFFQLCAGRLWRLHYIRIAQPRYPGRYAVERYG